MAPTNVGYSFKEAISHFFRNWTTSLGAVITIFLSLFIIGLFIMGSAMLNSVIGTVEDQVVINAFISDDADQADVQAFEAELKTWNNVKSVTYKDKDDALAEYTSKMSGNADATMSALDGQNPLPASFAIEMDDPSKVESTAQKLKKNADFQKIADDGDVNASVLYGQEEVSRLFQVTNYIRIAAVVLVGLLTRNALQSMWLWCKMCAHIVEVDVLPCVPATQSPLCVRVSVPSTCARFSTVNPFARKYCSSLCSAGIAGVYITRHCFGSRQACGISSTFSS